MQIYLFIITTHLITTNPTIFLSGRTRKEDLGFGIRKKGEGGSGWLNQKDMKVELIKNGSLSLASDVEVVLTAFLGKGVIVLVGEVEDSEEAQRRTHQAVPLSEVAVNTGEGDFLFHAAVDMRLDELLSLPDGGIALGCPSFILSL